MRKVNKVNTIRNVTNRLLEIFNVGAFSFLTLLVTWQVITRYFLNNPSTWSEELSGYMFAWVTLLGAAYVFGKREHMDIPIIVDRFSPRTQQVFAIVNEVIVLVFSFVVLIVGGVRITSLTMGQMSSSLNLPMGYFYIIIPISGVFIVIYNILNLYDLFKRNIGPEVTLGENEVIDPITGHEGGN